MLEAAATAPAKVTTLDSAPVDVVALVLVAAKDEVLLKAADNTLVIAPRPATLAKLSML